MSKKPLIRLGTRGSELALAQAELTTLALRQAHPDAVIERIIIHTTGDKRLDVKLTEFHQTTGLPLDKGAFTKELELALEEGKIDVAVHSLKDVPTKLGAGFYMAATLPRADVADVLFTKKDAGWDGIPQGGVLLTSSPRRHRMAQWIRPDLSVQPIRGNVPTRLRKFRDDTSADAMILAKAGLDRLGYRFTENGTMVFDDSELTCHILPPEEFPPAVGQGAVGLEIRENDSVTKELIEAINDKPTFFATLAEREFLRLLDAGCHTPVGVQSTMQGDTLLLHAMVFSEASPHDPPKKAAAKGNLEQAILVARDLFESLT